jgi:hypothetical protein
MLAIENTNRGRGGPAKQLHLPQDELFCVFRLVSKGNTMPVQDPALWRAHGMELPGPPLPV